MKNILILFLTGYSLILNIAHSQTKTPYEKEVDKIMTEMCKAIGVDDNLLQIAIKTNNWDVVRTSQDFAFKCKLLDKNVLLTVISIAEKRFKEAEKLKNEIDRKKDSDKKEKEEQERKRQAEQLEIQRQKEFQIEEEKRKKREIEAQQEIEKENSKRIEAEKKEYYQNSDYVALKHNISLKFENWLKQGEFEKSEEYSNRLNYKKDFFDSICHIEIQNRIIRKSRPLLTLGTYNPDKEYFPLVINWNNIIFKDTIKVESSIAKRFKDSINYYNVIFSNRENDWCFMDNYFNPKKFLINNINDSAIFEINIPQNNSCKQLILSSKELLSENYRFEELIYNSDVYESNRKKLLKQQFDNIINKAQEFEKSEDFKQAINQYKSALKFLSGQAIELNKDLIYSRVKELERLILIKEAEELCKSGKMSNGKQKYIEANTIFETTDISSLIKSIEENIKISLQKHKALSENYNEYRRIPISSKISEISLWYEINRNGYGIISNFYTDSVSKLISSQESVISQNYSNYSKIINREVWSDENQTLNELIISSKNNNQKLVSEISEYLIELNRAKLIDEAKSFFQNENLYKSKSKYIEANSIRTSQDISDKIDQIEKIISLCKQNQMELSKQYQICESSFEFPKFFKIIEDLNNIKNEYGEKYSKCIDSLNLTIRTQKNNLSKTYSIYQKDLKSEIWKTENQKFMEELIAFNKEYVKLKDTIPLSV